MSLSSIVNCRLALTVLMDLIAYQDYAEMRTARMRTRTIVPQYLQRQVLAVKQVC